MINWNFIKVSLILIFICSLIAVANPEKFEKKISNDVGVNSVENVDSIVEEQRKSAIDMLEAYEEFKPFAFSSYISSKTSKTEKGMLTALYNLILNKESIANHKKITFDTSALKNKRIAEFKKKLPKSLKSSQDILFKLAENGDEEAQKFLAEYELYGKGGLPMDLSSAFNRYKKLAENTGNPNAQFMLAIFYSTGLGGVETNPALSHIYLNMAALQDHSQAQVMLANKYYYGIEVPQNCEKSIELLQIVSKKSMKHYYSGPPLGRKIPKPKKWLYSKKGGIYGIRTSSKSPESKEKAVQEKTNLVEYYKFKASKKDLPSYIALYQIYDGGIYNVKQDYKKSAKYLLEAANLAFIPGTTKLRNPELEKNPHLSYLYVMLGKIYLHGEGVAQNYEEALKWFEAGAEKKYGSCHNALGIMYFDGLGVTKNNAKAINHFKNAAKAKHSDGLVYYGLSLASSNPSEAAKLFYEAMKNDNFRGYYYYSDLFKNSDSFKSLCNSFNNYYRQVIYNADWEYSVTDIAEAAYDHGAIHSSLVAYLISAEMGYKYGISNSAYLLEKYIDRFDPGKFKNHVDILNISNINTLTAVYWTRGANSGIVDCRLKQGDYYFNGIGVEKSMSKAAAAYMLSAELEENEMAMWNLGYMYEFGIGVKRDFHLAKRWYDRSLEGYKSSVLAVGYSMTRLAISYFIAKFSGEDVGTGPLFMAPPPKSEPVSPKNAGSNLNNQPRDNANNKNELKGGENGNSKPKYDFLNEGDDSGDNQFDKNQTSPKKKVIFSFTLSTYHIIAALCLLLGYLVIIRNRRANQINNNFNARNDVNYNARNDFGNNANNNVNNNAQNNNFSVRQNTTAQNHQSSNIYQHISNLPQNSADENTQNSQSGFIQNTKLPQSSSSQPLLDNLVQNIHDINKPIQEDYILDEDINESIQSPETNILKVSKLETPESIKNHSLQNKDVESFKDILDSDMKNRIDKILDEPQSNKVGNISSSKISEEEAYQNGEAHETKNVEGSTDDKVNDSSSS
ncbi:Protein sel-1-like protein [Smittium culicis]|uniref:Protein sel-1-like protein n=1 Tax=Smittium culicis TaxID=133412 RepID=A0A1R1YAG1_9FUNG|nr:Protein sel-1-like protein [Smittium culicis]